MAQALRDSIIRSEVPTRGDLLAFIDKHASNEADLKVVQGFLTAARAVNALRSYKAMKDASRVEKHCVRCHSEYTDEENGDGECVIPHVFDSDCNFSGKVLGYDKVYEYRAECCDGVTLEEEGAGDNAWLNADRICPCYEGRHTSDVQEVADEEEYNDANIFRCQLNAQGKCTREYLDYDEDEPIIR